MCGTAAMGRPLSKRKFGFPLACILQQKKWVWICSIGMHIFFLLTKMFMCSQKNKIKSSRHDCPSWWLRAYDFGDVSSFFLLRVEMYPLLSCTTVQVASTWAFLWWPFPFGDTLDFGEVASIFLFCGAYLFLDRFNSDESTKRVVVSVSPVCHRWERRVWPCF